MAVSAAKLGKKAPLLDKEGQPQPQAAAGWFEFIPFASIRVHPQPFILFHLLVTLPSLLPFLKGITLSPP